MRCSNIESGLSVFLTQADMDQINEKCGMVGFWALKQTGPQEFMMEPAAEGEGVRIINYGDSSKESPYRILFAKTRPKTLTTRFWGAAAVKEINILRSGIKFTPDMTNPVVRRPRGTEAERIHRRAEALTPSAPSALMSLRDFTQAVEKVNQFVTENEGHVVLEVRNGLLKFLAEG